MFRTVLRVIGSLLLLASVAGGTVGQISDATGSVTPTSTASGTPDRLDGLTADRAEPERQNPSTATLTAVYPNPVADGDRGEFVVIRIPQRRVDGNYTLSDGETTVRITGGGGANGKATGSDPRVVAVTDDPALVRNLTDRPVINSSNAPTLSNSGERLVLRRDGERVDSLRYEDAPEGELGRVNAGGRLDWRPLGATNRSAVTARGGEVRAFVLPDAPAVALEVLRNASDRILLAGYTLTSQRVAQALVHANDRGVDVQVLLEGAPVSGISRRQARTLDRLVAAGVSVRLIAGPRARYDYHHAKYAVVDERAVVLTENWKAAGTGGRSSRGWGVVVSQPEVVRGLAETFNSDATWRDAKRWEHVSRGRRFEPAGVANGSYPSQFDARTVPVNETTLLVTPDNAEAEVLDALRSATDSIDVIQMSIGGRQQAFLQAVLAAAERDVHVRVLLSSAWYVEKDNRRLVDALREYAERRGLPIEARLASPAGRYEKIHAKGAIIDGERVLLGSLNWNDEASRNNREVVLLLEGCAVADYYGEVFERDWEGERTANGLPVGLLAAVCGCVLLAVLVGRRISFEETVGVS